jgi:acetyl esterase/lipase
MKIETIALTSNPGVTLTAYLLDYYEVMSNTKLRPSVVVLPGGGYQIWSEREAEPVAMAFLAEGYQAFILRYSLNENANFPRPLNDAEEALRILHSRANDWGLDLQKIAVCGFSAGGHLAAALGTMGSIRPNALILAYPAILDSISELLPAPVPSIERYVDGATPPAFIFATAQDELVPVNHSLQFAVALDRAGVPFELHIFQRGLHGLSLSKPLTSAGLLAQADPHAAKWLDLCLAWLRNLFGDFPAEKRISAILSLEKARQYSVDIALGEVLINPSCKSILLEYFPSWDAIPFYRTFTNKSFRQVCELYSVIDEVSMAEIDAKLKKVTIRSD